MSDRKPETHEFHIPPDIVPADVMATRAGLDILQGIVAGELPQPPMCEVLDFRLTEVSAGRTVFEGIPNSRFYNPLGTVHGGFAATLLDSALGCAIFSALQPGEGWTTLELKINYVRALTRDTGPVRAEGRVIHRGRTVATSEGDLRDRDGKLYAHATTTCMIFPPERTGSGA
jgi:uncharacterized protein (TIGR00369 family)